MAETFLALAWADSSPPTEHLASLIDRAWARFGLDRIFDGERLCVLAHRQTPHALIDGRGGVVVGPLFSRDGSLRNVRTGHRALQAPVVQSAGDSLLKSVWGAYVAFVAEADGTASHVLRDPSGFLPCYWCTKDGLTAFFSDIEVPIALGWSTLNSIRPMSPITWRLLTCARRARAWLASMTFWLVRGLA